MRISLDTSFFLAVTNNELSRQPDVVAATLRLMRGESTDEFYLSTLAYEELCRASPDAIDDLESEEFQRAVAAATLREAATTIPLDRRAAQHIAMLWRLARTKEKLTETVDTLIARDARRADCLLFTCDKTQAKYCEVVFGPDWVCLVVKQAQG